MKKIIFLTTYLLLISLAEADTNIPLKDYLEKKDIEDGKTQIYLLLLTMMVQVYQLKNMKMYLSPSIRLIKDEQTLNQVLVSVYLLLQIL
mgnify:CR=1 FL=1